MARAEIDIKGYEECWTLIGERRGRIWCARRRRYRSGQPSRVVADAAWALQREERRGNLIGFLHTHPTGGLRPSRRDVRTMRAWCDALGKSMLCLIAGPKGIAGFRFDDHRSRGIALDAVHLFARGMVIGVDHGRKVLSRAVVSRRGIAAQAGAASPGAVRRRRAGIASGG